MGTKWHKPEEIVTKLRQGEVMFEKGGETMSIGFENMASRADWDYENVVFSVAVIDDVLTI